ncbi:peptidoglycan recognition protein [Streptomyces yaanensis]|uniref:Peptidoglycan recognition protein n=1 Tax=Streptomyces yaanensis TaxID=1142239 RepID=A0ABV7SAF7_9ACTN|nr:peptidoglycan recognition protein [Streptomyces sp. CGMCC 4.7035]WNC02258.1 peptidoglycan recognition protein [Streptomyces sp. CGMCC 4.7035]
MRGYLASSIGVTCAAVLTLSSALPAMAAVPGGRASSAVAAVAAVPGGRASSVVPVTESAPVPGSTQSLPLVPLTGPRATGVLPERGLGPQAVRSFSLVGVVWDDPGIELNGRVQLRTRASGTTRWSDWQEVETHNAGHGPDPGTMEGGSSRMRGSTEPLWVGDSDGIEVRVRAEEGHVGTTRAPVLPDGLRVELVDPGAQSLAGAPTQTSHAVAPVDPPGTDESDTVPGAYFSASAPNADLAPLDALKIPALSKKATTVEASREAMPGATEGSAEGVQPYIGPRPSIITRRGWGADETLREAGFVYTDKVKVAFVHHTGTGNNYSCSQAPSVIRSIYRYHVVSSGWRDIGYNFLVDKCGNIYEGRAGGVAKPVMGAHTLGFNDDSMGIAVLGSYSSTNPSAAVVNAIAKLSAWKLGLYGMDPRAATYLTSAGGNLYPKGENARLNVISGHRDGFATDCPGRLLYGKLGSARSTAALYQGR